MPLWLSCMYFSLPNIVDPKYIQYPTGVILPHVQNILGIYRQINILILYQVTSKLLTFFKNYFMLLYDFLICLFLMFVSNSSVFKYSLFFFQKYVLVSWHCFHSFGLDSSSLLLGPIMSKFNIVRTLITCSCKIHCIIIVPSSESYNWSIARGFSIYILFIHVMQISCPL